jgi:hypothetical protein
MRILNGDNLQILKSLEGERFDLAELDGPYMAGLEGWDILTEAEYIQHYAERLTALRPLLQPWGVVFVFGYPEGVAEIKSWAHRTNVLYCRRWLHWYNNNAAHAGRRVQVSGVFVKSPNDGLFAEFREWLKQKRGSMGITIEQAHNLTGIHPGCRGGYIWFESESSSVPTSLEYATLKKFFDVPERFDMLQGIQAYPGITDIDFLTVPVEIAEQLNDNGLRSKPIQLYVNLFKPTIPPTEKRKALILYGGSGNAAIAAEALGYEVTIIEQDPKRCKLIEKRSSRLVKLWQEKLSQGGLWGFPTQHAADAGDSPTQQAFFTPETLSTPQGESTPTLRR